MELLAFLASFIVSLACAPAGVSGAFLLLPLQIYIFGVAAPTATSTNLFYNVAAAPMGVLRYAKERRLMAKLSLFLITTALPGFTLGVLLRTTVLLDPALFKTFVAFVLLAIAARLIHDIYKKEFEKTVDYVEEGLGSIRGGGERYIYSPAWAALASAVVGVVGGAYGIGGGALMSPILTTVFRLPVYATAGATLLVTFATSIYGVFIYAAAGYPPTWNIALPMALGGAAGVYTGAYLQKRIPPIAIKTIILVVTLAIAIENLIQLRPA
ncbi:MAG: sulfite exporter TauE/SafE family protein [Pyrobaculum sp.]